jgi:hypothetical protein
VRLSPNGDFLPAGLHKNPLTKNIFAQKNKVVNFARLYYSRPQILTVPTLEEFKSSLLLPNPPNNFSNYLKAMWYAKKEEWVKAHDIAQNIDDKNGSLIHAYLHRKEGDLWNAEYWYRKAGKLMPDFSLDREWDEIIEIFL